MPNDVRYDRSHHSGGSPEERIANRYKNSGGDNRAGHTIQTGQGPNRLFTNIHDKGHKQGNIRERSK